MLLQNIALFKRQEQIPDSLQCMSTTEKKKNNRYWRNRKYNSQNKTIYDPDLELAVRTNFNIIMTC